MLTRRLLALRTPLVRSLCFGKPEYVDPSQDEEFMRLVRESAGKPNDLSDDFFWHNAPVVSAYSSYSRGGKALIGIFWKAEDERNVLKTITSENKASSALEALIAVLRQAVYERHMDKLVVNIHSDYVAKIVKNYLKVWKENDYKKKDGSPVKNRELIEEIDHLLGKLTVDVRYISAPKVEDTKSALESQFPDVVPEDAGTSQRYAKSEVFNPEALATFGPVVYTSASIHEDDKNFVRCGFAIKWADAEHQVLDDTRRLSMVPTTQFRAHLSAIELALQKAVEQGLKTVVVVTDSIAFMRFHSNGWRKADGSFIPNHAMYKKICDHLEHINAKFVLMPQRKAEPGSDMQQVRLMAEDGLAYPTIDTGSKQPTLRKNEEAYYDRENTDDTSSKYHGCPRLYLMYRRVAGHNFAFYSATAVVRGPADNPEISFHGFLKNVDLKQTARVTYAQTLLKYLKEHNEPCIIRSNSLKFLQLCTEWLPAWESNGFVTRKGTPVQNKELFEELGVQLKSVEAKFELARGAAFDEDGAVAKRFVEYTKQQDEDSERS